MVDLGLVVRDKLTQYLSDLMAQQGRSATRGQLVGALLDGVPLWQADLMLRAYIMHTQEPEPAGDQPESVSPTELQD